MTTSTKMDRRVLRTRRALREALLALVLEHGWEATSVQDVCARANVGRSTFAAHFADKEELFLSGFDDLPAELRAARARAPLNGGEVLGFARALLEHAQEYFPLARAVARNRQAQAIQSRLRRVALDLVREDLAVFVPPSPQREVAVHYIAGAFVEVLFWWLESRSSLDAAELEAMIHRLTAPVVAALRDDRRR
jgi:AcrR family transcriptional regulator